MPLEVRELIIKTTVDDQATGQSQSATTESNSEDKAAIVQLCVEKVLEIIKEKQER